MDGFTKRKIAVLVENMDKEYSGEILSGIMQEAVKNHYDIYVFNAYTGSDDTVKHNNGQYNIYALVNLSEFDGVIVFANSLQGRAVYSDVKSRLQGIDIPVVTIDATMEDHYSVGIDNYHSMKSVVEHFIVHHKFTKINYIEGNSTYIDTQLRKRAYCDALREHGIPVEEKRILQGDFRYESGQGDILNMLASDDGLPQAVVCVNDGIALALIRILREQGLKVPEQIAVSGFDNIAEARNANPRLTTVARALKTVGKGAVRKIKSHLDKEQPEKWEVYPSTPIFAGSCGCKYEEEDNIDVIRQRYLNFVDSHERYLAETNNMIEDLNDSKSIDDLLDRLKKYVKELECERFYLCLNKDTVGEGYAPEMKMALAYEYGTFVDYDDFASEQMLPFKWDIPGGSHAFIFAPVHFGDVCLGYIVVESSKFALNSSLFRLWLINLSSGLENLRKQTDLKHMLARLDKLYVTDQLTELYNRFGFTRYTSESYKNCVNENKQLMILFADLDGLKEINDLYGHEKGDVAIRAVADALREACAYGEVCARYGGDEYLVYAADYDEEKAEAYCKRFENALLRHNQTLKQAFSINASYGYELFVPSRGESIVTYIEKADKKMYISKNVRYAADKKEDVSVWKRGTEEK